MSLYHFGNWLHELEHNNERPTHLINQQFGHNLTPHDFLTPILAPIYPQLANQLQGPSRAQSSLSLQSQPSHDEEHYLHRLKHHPTYADLRHVFRPWHLSRTDDDQPKIDEDSFVVILDVQQFSPNEITVKVVKDAIVVEGKHEEKQDEHGYISRKFTRRYVVPETHDISQAESHLSSDGVLTLTAPKITDEVKEEARVIPIIPTGPHKHVRQASIE